VDPESLNTNVMKYVKTVMQLEKGLPPNSVVPILKEKVDKMRHKVRQIISYTSLYSWFAIIAY
jgi:dynein heavy chain